MGYTVEYKVDTRSVDLDTGKPIAGSGDARACDFCGKAHEIHVYVVNAATNDRKCCGSTCAPRHASDKRGVLKIAARDLEIAPCRDKFGRTGWAAFDPFGRVYDVDADKTALITRARAIRNVIEHSNEVTV